MSHRTTATLRALVFSAAWSLLFPPSSAGTRVEASLFPPGSPTAAQEIPVPPPLVMLSPLVDAGVRSARIAAHRPRDPAGDWFEVARARVASGDLLGAEAVLLAAYERSASDDRALLALAELYLEMQRPGSALFALERARARRPESGRLAELLARARFSWQPGVPSRRATARASGPASRSRRREPPGHFLERSFASLAARIRAGAVAAKSAFAASSELQGLAFLAAGLLALGAAWWRLRPRGDLAVSLVYPAELRGTFRVRVFARPQRRRRAATPADVLHGGASSPTDHRLVSRETHFQRLSARRLFVSVEGVLQDPETHQVVATRVSEQTVRIRSRSTIRLEFDLCPGTCPVDVRVLWDGAPPRDALVTARALPPGALYDASRDSVRLALPPGGHTLLVGSGDRVIEREIELDSFRPGAVEIDIAEAENPVFKGCPPAVDPYLRGDIAAASRALARDGQVGRAHLLLAEMHEQAGRSEKAAQDYEQAGCPGRAAELWEQLGDLSRAATLYDVSGDLVRAAEVWLEAGEPNRAGEAYERCRDFDRAIECYREAGDASKCVDALDRRGDTFAAAQIALDNGWRARAIRLLRTLPPDDPHFAEACGSLADIFEAEGHWELAAQKLEEQISSSGPAGVPADLHARLADLVERMGNFEKALAMLEELRRREPTFPNVATRIEMLRKRRSSVRGIEPGLSPAAGTAPTLFLSDSRYEILEEIGRGGMGIVFRARDRRLSRMVALKRLPESLKNYPKAVQLFLHEAQAMAGLNHPHIVTVYDADQEEGCFFITMELLDGEPVHRTFERHGRFDAPEVARFGVHVADGLQFAHQNKVIHRDIKTANLFLCADGVVKIMDFGLAKTLEEVRRIETGIGGTPLYMAPEQVLGEEVGPAADLYSLGVTLYELATGGLPFLEGDVTYHHCHTPAADPREQAPELPAAMAELILQLLRKNPLERCADASEVMRRLEPFLEG